MNHTVKQKINQIEKWLKKPIESTIEDAIKLADTFLIFIREVMNSYPETKKTLGPLVGKIKGIQNTLNSLETINWVDINQGSLAIGHRPSAKLMTDLRYHQTTHVLTLLSEKEGGSKINSLCVKNEIEWLWFPMESAKPPAEERHKELADLLLRIEAILSGEGKIYVHCSAGIHRTGMISYALLKFMNYDSHDALSILSKLRDKTSEGVGEERVEWADSISNQLRKLIE